MRIIKPEFFTSEQVVECSTMARLLFVGMWCFCDDGGVHPASFSRLKMEVFPGDDFSLADIELAVEQLKNIGLITSYVVDGKEFWRVTGWHHQKIEKPTYLYPRSREFGEESSNRRRMVGDSSPPESSRVESKGEKSKEVESKDSLSPDGEGGGSCELSWDEFVSAWNSTSGVTACRAKTAKRLKALQTRLKDPGWEAALRDALKKFPLRCFANEPNGWKPDIDWILGPDAVTKVLEGKYDWEKKTGDRQQSLLSPRVGAGQRYQPDE